MLKTAPAIIVLLFVSCTLAVYFTPCSESTTRLCSYGNNMTDRLLNLKKGGSSASTLNTYNPNFYLCE